MGYVIRHKVQSGYNLDCKCTSQHNQLKPQPNAPIYVKACTMIRYINLEHGQLRHKTTCL